MGSTSTIATGFRSYPQLGKMLYFSLSHNASHSFLVQVLCQSGKKASAVSIRKESAIKKKINLLFSIYG